jgi:glycosyltransferase involved in cell wall biosynthesis
VTRVLWLTKGLGRGGAERLLTTCAPHLDAGRFDVEVAYLVPWKDAYVDRLVESGVRVHCLAASRDYDPRWALRLHRLIKQGGYELVHTHSPLSAAVARVVTLGSRVKLVHTEHNMWSRYRKLTYWANALTYRRNDAAVAVSQAVAETIPAQYLSRSMRRRSVDVVHHGIDFDAVRAGPEARAKARADLGIPDDVPVLGTVGNLTEKKDHYTLIQAFRQVRGRHHDARLVIVGSGPLEQKLRCWISEAGLEDAVILTGSRDDATDLLAAFDIFVLSSRFEGLSIALVEALAAGVPAVCTRVGGVPEVLQGSRAGDMVPARDPNQLAGAINTLLANEERRAIMSTAAVARAQRFDVRDSVKRLESIYEEVLAGG